MPERTPRPIDLPAEDAADRAERDPAGYFAAVHAAAVAEVQDAIEWTDERNAIGRAAACAAARRRARRDVWLRRVRVGLWIGLAVGLVVGFVGIGWWAVTHA